MITPQTQYELKSARTRALISIGVNITLAAVKGIAGVLSGSTALLGDAIHSGTDVLASMAAFIGLWVAGRNHPSFPYGLYKAENVATLVTSIAIILAAYEIGRQALLGTDKMPDVAMALPVAFGCLLLSLGFGLLQLRAGKRFNSPALKADARDYLADSLSTGVVLMGLIATSLGWPVDRWAAAIVSLFVFKAGGGLLVAAIRDLLDASIDRETEREIIHMVEACPRVTRVKKCLSRTTGGRFIIDLDIIIQSPSHKVADQVSDRLEKDIPEKFPLVVMARVRPHYGHGDTLKRIAPVVKPDGDLFGHLGSAPWFLVETLDRNSMKAVREYVENPFVKEERKKGFLVGRWLLSMKPDELCLPDDASLDGTAVALLKEAGVEIKTVKGNKFSAGLAVPMASVLDE
ncbi:MAG: cation diffusion facilitator family transporter [Desulfobulbaceae bacterium]|uniref:Cation diffusion facilitator family transporter n=1 Tax=Candidatus Desulfobia pelagia TaxID=2841692 RepID=A0A8J6TF29_9BACT|nr:cation diffusion facilitator family transporter [Candidatus Desulfobia pelagia]